MNFRISLFGLGIICLVVGLLMILLAILGEGKVEYAGVIFIGPIPIIIGNNFTLILLTLILSLLLIFVSLYILMGGTFH